MLQLFVDDIWSLTFPLMQVHRAIMIIGGKRRSVVVKVRHPGVDVSIRQDFQILKPLAAAASKVSNCLLTAKSRFVSSSILSNLGLSFWSLDRKSPCTQCLLMWEQVSSSEALIRVSWPNCFQVLGPIKTVPWSSSLAEWCVPCLLSHTRQNAKLIESEYSSL